jgi:hypothetical protein
MPRRFTSTSPAGLDGVSVRRSTISGLLVLGSVNGLMGDTMGAEDLVMRAKNRPVGCVGDVVEELTVLGQTAAARWTA